MVRFLLRRALWGLVTLFVFQTILFFGVQILIPGDFASQFRLFMRGEEVDRIRQALGLDLPLGKQYLHWLGMLLRGDLGSSFSGSPVGEILLSAIPFTLLLFVLGTAVAFLLGQWLGKVTAWRERGVTVGAMTLSAIVLYTSFPPWLAFLMFYFFGRRLMVFRSVLSLEASPLIWKNSPLSAKAVMWYMLLFFAVIVLVLVAVNAILGSRRRRLPTLFSILLLVLGPVGGVVLLGVGPQALDILYTICLPMATFVLLSFGETMLIMRTSMVDTRYEDYVLVARAKGLPEQVVRDKHAARNALLPVLSRLVTSLPYLLAGLVIIEFSFAFSVNRFQRAIFQSPVGHSGVGSTLFWALANQDMPLVMGAMLLIGLFSLGARLFLDVLYAYLDPRIRYDTRSPKGLE